ncbi:MAG: radical SAM protein [Bacteroidales bacterium]
MIKNTMAASWEVSEIVAMLRMTNRDGLERLYAQAYEKKIENRGANVYFRGLIEISNKCRKNCLYCGIRNGNEKVVRYDLTDKQVLDEAQFALDAGYGSVVLQGGEQSGRAFTERITGLVEELVKLRRSKMAKGVMKKNSDHGGDCDNDPCNSCDSGSRSGISGESSLGITLSLGEQSKEVYHQWYQAGAHRYLLRIEASNKELYNKIHPVDNDVDKKNHSYESRIQALKDLQLVGYLTGTGVMIGLPFQTYEDLAHDLLFFKELGVDMVGMGPYIPHGDTPLGRMYPTPGELGNLSYRGKLELSLKMVAVLRCLMPHINIAATTALQVLAPDGRERALLAGANIIMPNVTDLSVKGNYNLYDGKPGLCDDAGATKDKLEKNLAELGIPIGWDMKGDWR